MHINLYSMSSKWGSISVKNIFLILYIECYLLPNDFILIVYDEIILALK